MEKDFLKKDAARSSHFHELLRSSLLARETAADASDGGAMERAYEC